MLVSLVYRGRERLKIGLTRSMQTFDYLIVGQGIAGTSVAWHLHWANKKILIIDNPQLPCSTRVAAGIFNPVTGRKLVKTWLADELFPYAKSFYQRIERSLETTFYHPMEMYRPFRNEAEKERYLSLAKEESHQPYISTAQTDYPSSELIHAPLDGITIKQAGWVDLPNFLDQSRNYFEKLGSYLPAHFSTQDLTVADDGVLWQNLRFGAVINCMGVGAEQEKLFNWLPFNPVKGQIIDCFMPGYDLNTIVNQGIFILPQSEEMVRVGATYSWHDLDWNTSQEGRAYLDDKLRKLVKRPYKIIAQQAGIRPSSKDRRPFVGRHPQHERIYILNGLGTKGVTLAPYFAGQLTKMLLFDEELHPDVNINRYFSLYSNPGSM